MEGRWRGEETSSTNTHTSTHLHVARIGSIELEALTRLAPKRTITRRGARVLYL